jgi:hypothetical protein
MAGVLGLDHLGARGRADGVVLAGVVVAELGPHAVDLAPALLRAQEAEHVVEGAVLHHQDHQVVELGEVGQRLVLRERRAREVIAHGRALEPDASDGLIRAPRASTLLSRHISIISERHVARSA